MTTPAGGNLVGDAQINVNANTDPAARALRDFSRTADGRLRDLRGRFVSESRLMGTAFNRAAGGGDRFAAVLGRLKSAAVPLAPALIPIAAQAAPIAAGVGAAAVAVGAFAAAAAGQVSALSEASEAEKKYKDAVVEHGAASKQASDASAAYGRQMAQMPPATREASAALTGLKDRYQEWSDGLASSTMPVATKAMQTFGALFPKLTPMVQGASGQLNRFVTIAAGGVASPGFDRLMDRFAEFSTGAMSKANDALIRFMRTADAGKVSGGVSEFMEYVRANGPLVRETLSNVVEALSNVLQAAANVGPGLLTVVNALAGLVAAVPPGVITTLLQLALAMKAVRLAAVAMAATSGAAAGFAASLGAMRLAAAGATGVLPRLAAAFGTLSRSAKVALAGTGIGLVAIALSELAQVGRKAPPDIDRMTTSLGRLAQTGKVSGEAARVFGSDFGELGESLRTLERPSNLDKVQQSLTNLIGMDSTPVKDAKANFDGLDEGLANLVKGGNAELAAKALDHAIANLKKQGFTAAEVRAQVDGYKASLADQTLEQQVAAQAMGLFGQQAQATSAKLSAQKAAAEGLKAAITALNEVNQSAYGAQIQFEGAIDSLTASFKQHGATLDIDTAAGQANGQAMLAAAKSQDELVASGIAAGSSLESMTGKSNKLRETMLRLATEAFDGNTKKAQEYTNKLLGTPDTVVTLIKAERADAIAGLQSVQSAIKATPGAKTIKVDTLNAAAIQALEAVGLKTKQLPNGKTEVTTANGQALGAIATLRRAMDAINGKTAKTYTSHYILTVRETRAVYNTVGRPTRGEGGVSKYASGGTPSAGEMAMVGEEGPELVVFGQAARVFDATTTKTMLSGTVGAGQAAAQGLAAGLGSTSGVFLAARTLASAVESGIRQELQISSPSKVTKALAKDIGKGFIDGLTGSRAKIKATSADLAKDIRAAFSGRKEAGLLRMVKDLTFKLDYQAKTVEWITKKIAAANKFAADTAAQARSTGSLASIVQEDAYSPKFVEGQMKASLNAIKAFQSNVTKLQKKGVNKDLLKQILEMGPEKGGAFAKSLAGADAATIKRFNSLNSQINSASSKLGKTGADMLFDAGKQASKGFLTGLKGQQKQVEDLMMRIAKSMQKAIKKSLGIKSPSRVMEALGRLTGLGLPVGIKRALPAINAAMRRVSAAVVSGAPTALPAVEGAMRRVAGSVAGGVPAIAPRVSVPQLSSMPTRRQGGGTATAPTVVHQHHYYLVNQGVIGSPLELQNWFVRQLDNAARTNRVPASLTAAVRSSIR
ncbi:hypothetical protein [Streptomyces lincolnensis]|uniref:hypothetical protein n=1 Tax=Streptomyces lincolnensis TaxID=1915 RepID=UPI0037D89DFB